jgi:TetR/AcrR family transcriptional regulator
MPRLKAESSGPGKSSSGLTKPSSSRTKPSTGPAKSPSSSPIRSSKVPAKSASGPAKSNGSSRRAAPRSVTSDPSKTPDRILAVAIREFANKGFAGARVEQIAKRARVNKQLLYYYFGGKKGLYDAAVREAARQSSDSWADLESLGYTDRMVALALRQTENAPMVLFARMGLWEALQPAAGPDETRTTNWSYGRQEVGAAQERGDLYPHLDTDLLTLVLAAVLLVPHTSRQGVQSLTGHQPYDQELLERHANFMRDFMTLLAPN